jgi:hypothetical protein
MTNWLRRSLLLLTTTSRSPLGLGSSRSRGRWLMGRTGFRRIWRGRWLRRCGTPRWGWPRFFVTEWSVDQMDDFMAGVLAVAGELGIPSPMPPASLIGVEILFESGVRVEVEASAVVE